MVPLSFNKETQSVVVNLFSYCSYSLVHLLISYEAGNRLFLPDQNRQTSATRVLLAV